jgi:hypothetical protein
MNFDYNAFCERCGLLDIRMLTFALIVVCQLAPWQLITLLKLNTETKRKHCVQLNCLQFNLWFLMSRQVYDPFLLVIL